MMENSAVVQKIMTDFAERTGLATGSHKPKRYLWTDAFAVCNFLELFHQTGKQQYRQEALNLVEQVHHVLGRHREDDPRNGWISGLDEKEGELHPTIGGLRIGKRLNERKPDDPHNERLEWEQDGQYFHYLTKWMHALNRVTQVTGNSKYNRWAMELAKTAHAKFTYTTSIHQQKLMYWKMSIDLSRPLVTSMGQHDALDALITYYQLEATAVNNPEKSTQPDLWLEIADAETMCSNVSLATDDPLGIGGLLSDACTLTQLIIKSNLSLHDLLSEILSAAKNGLESFALTDTLRYPPDYRLAFRELGLSISLQAVEKILLMIHQHPENFSRLESLPSQLASFRQYLHIKEIIENFWLVPENQKSPTWREHLDINSVMLATSLAPDGYLILH
ncbi:MAG TPA: hypothetical protein ENF28_05985 [Proteobacteria bacterium]|nr:hypothetical protein [Pseudomonadota bacterium]